MRFTLVMLTVLILTGCGRKANIEFAFSEYYSRFANQFNVNPDYVSIEFKETLDAYGPSVVGVCSWNNGPQIYIDKEFWDYATDAAKEALIYHELGHCAMGWDHNDALLSDGCHASVMNSWMDSDYCYLKHRPENLHN